MSRIHRALIAAVVGVAVVAASGCSSTAGPASDESSNAPEQRVSQSTDLDSASADELYELAKKEGKVVVYSFTSRIAKVEKTFEAEYPGVDLVGVDISATKQIARIKAEAKAGAEGADVAYLDGAPTVLTQLVKPGLLTKYVPPRVADVVPAENQQPLLANRISTKVLMYNAEANPSGSPVTNLWQLTEDEWNGRVVMVDPNVRGDYLDLVTEFVLHSDEMAKAYKDLYGKEISLDPGIDNAGSQYIKDLYANGVVLVDDTDTVNAAVGAKGQDNPPVGFTSYSDSRDNQEEGWALHVAAGVAPSSGITYPAMMGIVKGAAHPAAARLVIDFLMGDDSPTGGESYAPFYVAGDYPTRTDITIPDGAVSLDTLGAWAIDAKKLADHESDVSDFLLTIY